MARLFSFQIWFFHIYIRVPFLFRIGITLIYAFVLKPGLWFPFGIGGVTYIGFVII